LDRRVQKQKATTEENCDARGVMGQWPG